ncbi:MAG: glycosyltransferase family 2 protein [Cyclobacteriaceae bacterium]|nr:MAG: glycosyltransferase family 2 protein [Cyclobacteriaceae bacterium]
MLISVICPILNEAEHIQSLIDFFINSLPDEKELFLVDGGSTDGTLEIIGKNQEHHPEIHLLHNAKKVVPYALNLAIPNCVGKFIVRLDGHSVYSDDYFVKILETFARSGADIVGGPTRTRYKTSLQEAIAFSVTHPLGIGGSRVHDEKYEGFTDSVTFGAWKREVFEAVGLFDTQLVRNQDDEFHYRTKSLGFKIYQSPSIKLYYFPRSSITSLFKQYFQYGYYKPLVLRKVKSETKMRHLVPSIFVLYLLSLIGIHSFLYFIPLILYLLLILSVSFASKKKWLVKLKILIAIPCVHVAYGSGFLLGISKLFSKPSKQDV